MRHKKIIVDIFEKCISDIKYVHSKQNRILKETEYFSAYIDFINNSIHYSRYTTVINGHIIKGKYLNEKVNKWNKSGIFKLMFKRILDIYNSQHKSNIYHIDGKIVTNKYCDEHDKLGRNVKYKSKNSINVQSITDNYGISQGFYILKGSESEVNKMTSVIDKIYIPNYNYLNKSNRHKKYFTGDAGYNSLNNNKFLIKKGYTPIIWYNKRNVKNPDIIKEHKLKRHQKEKYKNRHIIENSFSWIETNIPRLSKLYDKKITGYMNMLYTTSINLMLNRICV